MPSPFFLHNCISGRDFLSFSLLLRINSSTFRDGRIFNLIKNIYYLKAIKWFDRRYYNSRLLKVVLVGLSNYDKNEYFMSFVFQNSLYEVFNVKYYPANFKESKFCYIILMNFKKSQLISSS